MLSKVDENGAPGGPGIDEAPGDAPPVRSGPENTVQEEHVAFRIAGLRCHDAMGKHSPGLPQIWRCPDQRAGAIDGTAGTSW